LQKIIGHWYTRQPVTALDAGAIPTGSAGELDVTSNNDLTDTTKEVYYICKGIDDGRRMVMCENDDNNTCCSGITAQLVIGYEGKSYYQPHTYSRAILKSYLSSYTESVENSYEKSQENDCTKL